MRERWAPLSPLALLRKEERRVRLPLSLYKPSALSFSSFSCILFHLFYQLCCPPLDIVKHLFFLIVELRIEKKHSKWGCSNAGRPASSSNEPAFSLNLLLLLARFKKLSLLSKTSPSRLNFSWALVFVFSSCKYKLQLCNLPVWPNLD